jgi:tetratricopeptide (TPR) repeat protein
VAARTDDGLGQVLVCASAHCELGEYDRAAVLFDRLENLWGHSALDLHLDDRFAWVQAMAEVGRFAEADEVCRVTLERVQQQRAAVRAGVITLGAEGLESDPTGHWAHVYEVMAGRLAQLQGRFAQGWDHFRAASDDDNESRELRRSALRLRLIQSGRTLAARALRDLEELAQTEKTDAAMLSFVEGSLWAATQWGSETPLALVDRGDETERYFSGARLRGQVAARALLARSGGELELGQRLRLLLLAGDDRTAERLLAAHTLTDADPWSVWVLAAVLALRTGLDARASDLLDQVLARRPHDIDLRILHAQAELFRGDYRSALVEAIACTDAMPHHVVARVVKAECEFETSLARKNAESSDGDGQSAENAQQLILAVSDYRRAADLHISTREYLETGSSSGAVGSEPLSPRLFQEVCRRGMHAAILAQEELDRLGLRGDRQLVSDAAALLQHLRRAGHRCCQALAGRPGRGLLHRLKHLGDRDEPSRLGWLLASHRIHTWKTRVQNVLLISMGVAVCWVGLTDLLPGPESEAIRATVFALGILLALMPFARTLKIGVVELQRAEAARPVFGRSKALRTSSLMQRGYHLGSFALPATPEMGRSKREIVEADLGDGSGPASNPGIAALVTTPTPAG